MMAPARRSEVLVIGVGNPDRADDGIGPLVARRLSERHSNGARVVVCSGDVLGLIDDWAGAAVAILIDAAALLSKPGVVHRVDLMTDALPCDLSRPSTHAFGIPEAVALARALGRLPERVIVYAVECACFDAGGAMTAEVAAVADELAAHIAAEIRAIQHPDEARHA